MSESKQDLRVTMEILDGGRTKIFRGSVEAIEKLAKAHDAIDSARAATTCVRCCKPLHVEGEICPAGAYPSLKHVVITFEQGGMSLLEFMRAAAAVLPGNLNCWRIDERSFSFREPGKLTVAFTWDQFTGLELGSDLFISPAGEIVERE